MCRRVGIEWACADGSHRWRSFAPKEEEKYCDGTGLSCPTTDRSEPESPTTTGNDLRKYTSEIKSNQYFLKVKWCCSVQCCQDDLDKAEKVADAAKAAHAARIGLPYTQEPMPDAQEPETRLRTAKQVYGNKLRKHISTCLPRFIDGYGMINSMRQTKFNDIVPKVEFSLVTETTRSALIKLESGNSFDKFRDVIRKGQGGLRVQRSPIEQFKMLSRHILENPELSQSKWQPADHLVRAARKERDKRQVATKDSASQEIAIPIAESSKASEDRAEASTYGDLSANVEASADAEATEASTHTDISADAETLADAHPPANVEASTSEEAPAEMEVFVDTATSILPGTYANPQHSSGSHRPWEL